MTRATILIGVSLLGALGCRQKAPDAPPVAASAGAQKTIEVLKSGRWLFTYVEPEAGGRFATTDKPDAVPEMARRVVRVVDPAAAPAGRLDTFDVYVVDLGAVMRAGKAVAELKPRPVFESMALAQLPPGQSSMRAARPAIAGDAGAPATRDGSAPAGSAAEGGITLYGTSWCGACRSARAYFTEHKIPFVDRDIESDSAAAAELAKKGAAAGIPTDRIPVIDVHGRLLVGFDPRRVEALLGQRT